MAYFGEEGVRIIRSVRPHGKTASSPIPSLSTPSPSIVSLPFPFTTETPVRCGDAGADSKQNWVGENQLLVQLVLLLQLSSRSKRT